MSLDTFFLPGPTEVRRVVLEAMLQPMIPHRGKAFSALFQRVQEGLQHVFRTERPIYISTSSATGLMEAGIRCAPNGPMLSLVNGAFSERFAKIAEACGRSVDRYTVNWGDIHDPAVLAERLAQGHYSAITVVHSETSTGARNDVRTISGIAHHYGATCLIDSVSGIGGIELHFDAWGLDYVLTGSQKALALPPGLAFAVASPSFIAQAHDQSAPHTRRGVYFDLVEFDTFAQRGQAPNTPAISLYYALDRQLRDITHTGIEARWAHHTAMATQTAAWVQATQAQGMDIKIVAPDGHRSPTVTTIALPQALSDDRIVSAVADRGFTIGGGYGALKGTTIRIGHMGDHTLAGLAACLAACAETIYVAS